MPDSLMKHGTLQQQQAHAAYSAGVQIYHFVAHDTHGYLNAYLPA